MPEGRQLLAVVSRNRSADDDTRVSLKSGEREVKEGTADVVKADVDEAEGAELLGELWRFVIDREVDLQLVAQPAALLVVTV